MDDRFIRYVDDVTQEEWNLSSYPKSLSIQKDADFLNNYAFMNARTKIRLLLQFSVVSKKYYDEHKGMIDEFISRCSEDTDRWVSSIVRLLYFEHPVIHVKTPDSVQFPNELLSAFNSNALFVSPVPFSMLPFQQQMDKRKGQEPTQLPDKITLATRTLAPPTGATLNNTSLVVKGLVGVITKRKRQEATSAPHPKKLVVTTAADKPKPKTTVRASTKKSEIRVALPSPIPTGSNIPFVPLAPDDASSGKIRVATAAIKRSMPPLAKRGPMADSFCFAGLFTDVLQRFSYYGVQNEIGDIIKSFMAREEPNGIEWRNGDSDRKEVDLLVKVEKQRVLLLRVSFKDFTWQLISVKLHDD